MKTPSPTPALALAACAVIALLTPAGIAQAATAPNLPTRPVTSTLLANSFAGPDLPDGYAHRTDDDIVRQLGAIDEAFCTQDDFEPSIQDKLTENFQVLPVIFGTSDDPKDAQAEARRAVTGTEQLTNEARHQLCTEEGTVEYRMALDGFISEYGVQPNTVAGVTGPDDTGKIEDVWNARVAGFQATLERWLP